MKRGEGMVSGNGQVGAFIAERRKAKGWSQKDLAGVLQVTDKAVSRWERGAGYPDVTLLKPLALALDVSVAELLEGERLEDAGEEEKRLLQLTILTSLQFLPVHFLQENLSEAV